MPASKFAQTFESTEFFKHAGPWVGGVMAGAFIGVGLGFATVEAVDVVREVGQSVSCELGITNECGSYISEEFSDVLTKLSLTGALVALGGLVAVVSGARSEEELNE